MADIDLVEINEAFASVPMAWLKDLDYDHDKTNVNGALLRSDTHWGPRAQN